MRRLFVALALPLALAAAPSARAQSLKIGYVDVQRAVLETQEGRAARGHLETEMTSRKGDLEKKRSNLEKMKAEFDKQSAVLADDAKRKRQEELQKAYEEFQSTGAQAQQDLAEQEQRAMGQIEARLSTVISEVSQREGFSFVINKQALLYAPGAYDVTNEVVRRYDERFPSAGAPAKGTGKTSAGKKK